MTIPGPAAGLTACHECDLLLQSVALSTPRSQAHCPRCGAKLYSCHSHRLDKILALSLAALVLLLTANLNPIVGLNIQGNYAETTVLGAVRHLWQAGREALGGLVLLTTVLMPAIELGAVLWLVLPLSRGRRPPGFAPVFRAFHLARPWAMVEVFILGVLVSLVKLSHLADVLPGAAIWCFGGLMLLLAALAALLDAHALWQAWEDAGAGNTGAGQGCASHRLAVCEICGQIATAADNPRCPRCHTPLHLRKPDSLMRTWALMLAAYVLYLPANLLPIMETRSPFGTQQDTIMSGVVVLWQSGSWDLALVVFCASIVLPMLKLFSLTYLLLSVHRRSRRHTRQRARLYRLLELIGRWSMLDVYVVTLLVALVQVQSLAVIAPGPGVVAFGAVVVLSMLATMAFDPRLIWDRARPAPAAEEQHDA